MKVKSLFFSIFISSLCVAQLRTNFSQYMINPGLLNPSYMDINTRYSASLTFKRQWMSMPDAPINFAFNGHYSFTGSHGVGIVALSDKINDIQTTDIGINYAYRAYVNDYAAFGFGLKVSYHQRTFTNDYVYFSPGIDPTITGTSTSGVNVGFGASFQSRNFECGVSVPFLFDNSLGNKKNIYLPNNNHSYVMIGYKIRPSDWFIFYPSILGKASLGSPINISFDGHFLINQFYWFGGGFHTDKSATLSAGLFLDKGLRLVYTYETSTFTEHKRLDVGHEITFNYARNIGDSPFNKRRFIHKSSKRKKRPGKWY